MPLFNLGHAAANAKDSTKDSIFLGQHCGMWSLPIPRVYLIHEYLGAELSPPPYVTF